MLGLVAVQELERDLAVELGIPGRVNHPHPTRADALEDHVATDLVAARQLWARVLARLGLPAIRGLGPGELAVEGQIL